MFKFRFQIKIKIVLMNFQTIYLCRNSCVYIYVKTNYSSEIYSFTSNLWVPSQINSFFSFTCKVFWVEDIIYTLETTSKFSFYF